MAITLGSRVRDTVTGFRGIATARTVRISGVIQIGVESQELNAGQPITIQWFDEPRIQVIENEEPPAGHFV